MSEFEIAVTIIGTLGVMAFSYFGYRASTGFQAVAPYLRMLLEVAQELARSTPTTTDDEVIQRLLDVLAENGRIEIVDDDPQEVTVDLQEYLNRPNEPLG